MMDLTTVDELLTTTRSVRRRLDLTRPVDLEVVRRCIEIAFQAPTGSNAQNWHFLVVTDAQKRATIARHYKAAFEAYRGMAESAPQVQEGDPRRPQTLRIIDSATYLVEHLHEVPVHVIACVEGRVEQMPAVVQASVYGSILPSVWSLMLALRARGIGSAWTTLHIVYEKEVASLLGIPENMTQAALLPVAYYTGTGFKPAKRLPARDFIHWNGWGAHR
jgi:nitroreductase